MTITLIKGEGRKFLDPESLLIPICLRDGWVIEGEEKEDGERDALFAEAEALGLKPHHKAGVDKLKAMIAEAK